MLDRLVNVIKGLFNKSMSQLETPEILAEQAQMQLENGVKDLKEAVTSSITNEKVLQQQIEKNQKELETWVQRAAVAVQNNNDEVAKQCLQKKQEYNQNVSTFSAQLEEQRNATTTLKARYAEVSAQLREFEGKKEGMNSRAGAGQAIAKANELLGGSGSSKMDQWEQKIKEKELEGQMSSNPVDDKFNEMDKNVLLDNELAALKSQMGAGPKLIVDDRPSGKAVVDENVPMVVEDVTGKNNPGDQSKK